MRASLNKLREQMQVKLPQSIKLAMGAKYVRTGCKCQRNRKTG